MVDGVVVAKGIVDEGVGFGAVVRIVAFPEQDVHPEMTSNNTITL
jgi:hypothetical protein